MRSTVALAASLVLILTLSAQADQTIRWQMTLEGAKRVAAESNQLILIHFWAPYCTACRKMEQEVFGDPAIAQLMNTYYVPVKLNTEYFPATATQFGVTSLPTDLILSPQGQVLARLGPSKAPDYGARLNQVFATYRATNNPPPVYAQMPGGPAGGSVPPAASPNPVPPPSGVNVPLGGPSAVPNASGYAQGNPAAIGGRAPAQQFMPGQPAQTAGAPYGSPQQQLAPQQSAPAMGASPYGVGPVAGGPVAGGLSAPAPGPVSQGPASGGVALPGNTGAAMTGTSGVGLAGGFNLGTTQSGARLPAGTSANPAATTPIAPGAMPGGVAVQPFPPAAQQVAMNARPGQSLTGAGNFAGGGLTPFGQSGTPGTTQGIPPTGVLPSGSSPAGNAMAGTSPAGISPAGSSPPGSSSALASSVGLSSAGSAFSPPKSSVPSGTSPGAQENQNSGPGAAAASSPGPKTDVPPGNPPLGLDGFCPVTLTERQSWVPGDRRWGVIHRGRTYLFSGPEQQQRFFSNPDTYAPVMSGIEIVMALEQGMTVPGHRQHGVFFDNKIYLFSTEETLQRFSKNPDYYSKAILQAFRPTSYTTYR